jgi:L-seryl-tRNA(Ser) seleniumtransferase
MLAGRAEPAFQIAATFGGKKMNGPDIYDRLGVTKVINARSWVTALGGSIMRPEVFAAMEEAGQHFIDMDELMAAGGKVVARACGAEAGMVCAGAAAGNLLMAAAAITGTDRAKVDQIPDTTGMKNEFVIFKSQRNAYDHAFETTGGKLVEVGMPQAATTYQLEAAIGESTAAVIYTLAPFLPRPLTLEETIEIAHAADVPVLVDASAEVPPADNLTKPMRRGADMVTYSGGKGICGPQNSGLLAGRADLIEAAFLNYLPGGPRVGIARPAKVSKETIIGLVTAIELFLDSDQESIWAGWRQKCDHVVDRLRGIPGLRVVIEENENRQGPQPVIYMESEWSGPPAAEVRRQLAEGDPPIMIGSGGYGDELNVVMVNVRPGEEKIIADRLHDILTS